jgi:hypothetical protein
MVKETKLYDLLNISPNATQDEIKKAYRYVLFLSATPHLTHLFFGSSTIPFDGHD